MARFEKVPQGEFHSGYGCIIMSAVVAVFGFILWWAWYSLVTMDTAIAAVTQSAPAVMPEIPAVPDLEKRLTDFASEVNAGKAATLKLSVADLNALLVLAPDGGTGSYKDMLRIQSLDPAKNTLTATACLPMNTAKFWEDTKRYLVGELDFQTEMTAVGPDAKISAVRVPGKEIPDGMLKGMQMYGYMGPYQASATLSPILTAIKQVEVEADGIVLSTQPANP